MPIQIDSRIKRVMQRDGKVMFTTTRESFPFVVAKGSGDYAYDISGNRFIDFSSFIGVYTLGVNANAEVRRAVKEQADKLMHPAFLDYYSELPVRVAEKLLGFFPKGFGRVFFSNSGTEANEDAIKLAKLFTKRNYMISFYNSFHGRTMGSLGLTASKTYQRKGLGPFNGIIHVPFPYTYRCPFGTDDPKDCSDACLSYIESNVFGKEAAADEIAAIFMEPVQGEGGYIVPPKEFVKGLRKLTEENGILFVADEVQSGFMRTGRFLALDNFGVSADIYTMAKALGGGVPAGATIARRSLGDTPRGSHAGTFGGNLLAMAAANASLDYVKRNHASLQKQVKSKNRIMVKRLNEMKDKYEIIGDVRGLGMMLAAEFVKDRKTKAPAVKESAAIVEKAFYNGLLLLPTGESSIRLIPPITMSTGNIEKGLDIFEKAVKEADLGIKK